MVNVEGDFLGTFADIGNPFGLVFLPAHGLVAVTSQAGDGGIYFLNESGDTVGEADIDDLEVGEPRYISTAEGGDEVLVTTSNAEVIRVCVPSTSCQTDLRNKVMLSGGRNFRGIGIMRNTNVPDRYLVVDNGADRVYDCPAEISGLFLDSCSTFAYSPTGSIWDPFNILVDNDKLLVYIADNDKSAVHVYGFDGTYFDRLEESSLFLANPSAMALKPGSLATISEVLVSDNATAGEEISIGMALRTAANDLYYPSHDELDSFRISATGTRDGMTTSLQGTVTSASELGMMIKYAGVWNVSITEGIKNPQHLKNSPLQITVHPAETDPAECEAEFEQVIKAGSSFSLNIATVDAFGNPTEVAEFNYSCCVGEVMTLAGEYEVKVTPAIQGNPFRFDVKPDAPDASTSTHNIQTTAWRNGVAVATAQRSRGLHTVPLELRVTPLDKFHNTVSLAVGYTVRINGGDNITLSAPDYSYKHLIPEAYSGDIELAFMLDGKHIANSPITVQVEVVYGGVSSDVWIAIVAAFLSLLLVFIALIRYQRQRAKKKRALLEEGHHQSVKHLRVSMKRVQNLLMSENKNLQEVLKKKQHNEDELAVMKEAMDGLEKEQKDELKEVLIDSKEVKVDRLLGKGGFGVVNLATYRGQPTAMKQLLTINDESVKRFRFECFLMKSLRHPNIVKLVGVCWDDSLFACCLEFVENGSLEDWLRRTAGGRSYVAKVKTGKKGKSAINSEVSTTTTSAIPLSQVVGLGYDHNGQYDKAHHTVTDKRQLASAQTTVKRFAQECVSWGKNLKPDKTPLDHGAECWGRYDSASRCGEAYARIEVSASPAQIFALYVDPRRDQGDTFSNTELVDFNYTTELNHMKIPAVYLGMSHRESLDRGVIKKLDNGLMEVHYSVEDERRPVPKGAKRIWSEYVMIATEKEGSNGKVAELCCCLRVDPKLGGMASMLNGLAAKSSVAATAEPIIKLKLHVERLLAEYEPVLEENKEGVQSLTWRGQLLNIATQCALGVQYLHQEQYWAEEEVLEGGEVVPAGYRECIIHRDLKPNNMLLTKDWQLKLTDFGEARAVNLKQTMTSVGTPIYVAPEVMAGYSYDSTADSYSFGICLVAMIRGEKDVIEFYFQALRKTMKRKTKKGVGITILNNRMYSKGWRPLLPLEFERSYPHLCRLLKKCWSQKKEERPGFDEIVRVMQNEVRDEVRRREEPRIVCYGDEKDELYWARMGHEEDEVAVEEGGGVILCSPGGGASRLDLERAVELKDRVIAELRERLKTVGEKAEEVVAKTESKQDIIVAAVSTIRDEIPKISLTKRIANATALHEDVNAIVDISAEVPSDSKSN